MTDAPKPATGDKAAALHRRGLELLREGQAALGAKTLEQAAALAPDNVELIKNLGNARRTAGDLQGARAAYLRALEIAPEYLPARYNLGLVSLDLGQPGEAEQAFRRVVDADPGDPDALFNLAVLLARRSDLIAADRLYEQALVIAPSRAALWYARAAASRQIPGRMGQSVECLRRCLALDPEFAEAHHLLALTQQEEGRIEEALSSYRKATALDAGNAVFRCHFGNALMLAGQPGDAIESYETAVRLDPKLAQAHLNLGSAHDLAGAHDKALAAYESALALEPANAAARGCLLFDMQRTCEWSRLDELDALQRRSAVNDPEQEIRPFDLLSIPSTAAEQLRCASHYAARRAKAVARELERPAFGFDRTRRSRIRIGYLSADLREHPGAYLAAELFELHDRERFEVIAYSYGPDDGGAMRARLRKSFDRFVDIRSSSHADAASMIHADAIDILVDMTGYTTYSRPEILALRPAPVQVNYLGYPGTMGAGFIDYIVTDRYITPPGHERHLSEQPVFMPGSYQVNDRKRPVGPTPSRRELGLPDDGLVFCCFNHTHKLRPQMFAIWMRLIQSVSNSVLWLPESNRWAAENLRRHARSHGVAAERLVFAPVCTLSAHLGRIAAADLFLDTLPYNAHTSASDALWVGLPVVTCSGETFASRVAGSLLTAAGAPELIAGSLEEYERLALRLARDGGELAALRAKLLARRDTSALFDTPAYTRHLETAYLIMHENRLAGGAPRAISV